MKLSDSIRNISGIGPKRAEAFGEHGITTIEELLDFYPRKYLNRKIMGSLQTETEEAVTVGRCSKKRSTAAYPQKYVSFCAAGCGNT